MQTLHLPMSTAIKGHYFKAHSKEAHHVKIPASILERDIPWLASHGQSQIDVLLQSPKRFTKVYALSRRAPQVGKDATAVQHVAVDLLDEPADTAKKLKDVGAQAYVLPVLNCRIV